MAIARQGATTGSQSVTAPTALTINHTVSAGSNLFLIVGAAIDLADSPTFSCSSDVDGALTKIGEVTYAGSDDQPAVLYGKVAPTVGAHVITIGRTSGSGVVGIVAVYTGVDQATPYADATTQQDTGTSGSVTVPNVVSGNVVFDILAVNGNETITVGANQTQLLNASDGNGAGGGMGCASEQAGSDGGVMSWTWTNSQRRGLVAVRLIAAAGGATVGLRPPARTMMGMGR